MNSSNGVIAQYMVLQDCDPRGQVGVRMPAVPGLDTTDAIFQQTLTWMWIEPGAPASPQAPNVDDYADFDDYLAAYAAFEDLYVEWQAAYFHSGTVTSGNQPWPSGSSMASWTLTLPEEALQGGAALELNVSVSATFYEPGSDPLNPISAPAPFASIPSSDFAWLEEPRCPGHSAAPDPSGSTLGATGLPILPALALGALCVLAGAFVRTRTAR